MKLQESEKTHRSKVWEVMNELDMFPSKLIILKHLLESVQTSMLNKDVGLAEYLIDAAQDLVEYYTGDFEKKFQVAWQQTLATADAADQNSTKSWTVPVEETPDGETLITFPDELINSVGWVEGDTLQWNDNKDGTFTLKKV